MIVGLTGSDWGLIELESGEELRGGGIRRKGGGLEEEKEEEELEEDFDLYLLFLS